MAGTMRKGNWFEEAALQDYTGIKHFDPKSKESGKYTHVRCIEHSDRLEAKNFESVMASCIKDPAQHEHSKLLKDRVGPRFAMLEKQYKEEINQTMNSRTAQAYTKNREVEYVSENGRNFNRDDFKASLNESVDDRRVPTHSANYCVEPAITFFSESINRGDVTFPVTFAVAGNPFRKSSAFSQPIEAGHVSSKTESNERPRPFPTATEYAGVKSFRERLIRHTSTAHNLVPGTGKVISRIVNSLWGLVSSSSSVPQVHVDALVSGLEQDLGFCVNDLEYKGILRTFNDDNTGNIALPELTDFIRGTLNPRSGELVDIILGRLSQGDGSVVEADVQALYKGSEDIAINKSTGGITVDDLYEFFTDCAAELETSENFENMLRLWM